MEFTPVGRGAHTTLSAYNGCISFLGGMIIAFRSCPLHLIVFLTPFTSFVVFLTLSDTSIYILFPDLTLTRLLQKHWPNFHTSHFWKHYQEAQAGSSKLSDLAGIPTFCLVAVSIFPEETADSKGRSKFLKLSTCFDGPVNVQQFTRLKFKHEEFYTSILGWWFVTLQHQATAWVRLYLSSCHFA